MKFLDDSAWFCLEKLKKHVFSIKTLTFDQQSPTYFKKPNNNQEINENISFPRVPCGPEDLWTCERQVGTCPTDEFWSNFARFGFKIRFVINF